MLVQWSCPDDFILRAHEGKQVDLVARGQVGYDVVVSYGRALLWGIGELRGEKQYPHSLPFSATNDTNFH
jgi:hypothetical protein